MVLHRSSDKRIYWCNRSCLDDYDLLKPAHSHLTVQILWQAFRHFLMCIGYTWQCCVYIIASASYYTILPHLQCETDCVSIHVTCHSSNMQICLVALSTWSIPYSIYELYFRIPMKRWSIRFTTDSKENTVWNTRYIALCTKLHGTGVQMWKKL